jgi:hypothetical protein
MNWFAAQTEHATARFPDRGKPIANNTRIFARGEDFAVRLHDTDVVTIHRDGTYTLDSGGWLTVTTKERINRYSPAAVYSEKGVWVVYGSGGRRFVFEDGMRVDADGDPIGDYADADDALRKKARLDRAVRRYVDGFARQATVGAVFSTRPITRPVCPGAGLWGGTTSCPILRNPTTCRRCSLTRSRRRGIVTPGSSGTRYRPTYDGDRTGG